MRGEELWRSEELVSEALGRLIEFWGFKRNMGRLWGVLYLSPDPLDAPSLQARLGLSSGSVSMTLSELQRWRVVRKVHVAGKRRDHFEAERNLWRMISRVFREREMVEILEAIDAMEEALAYLEAKAEAAPELAERASFQRARIASLLRLARLGRDLLRTLIDAGRVDATPLISVLLGELGSGAPGVGPEGEEAPTPDEIG